VARSYFASSAKQTTNLASINMTQLKDCGFPVPPLAEQSRIVTRVTALRRLCADLRQRLADRQSVQGRLAQALVDEAAGA
jgi:type I restriction enzyme S subunit